MLNCNVKFVPGPDPATTPLSKQPAKQLFSAKVNGTEVVAETEYEMSAEGPAVFQCPEDASVELALRYAGASGLFSEYARKTVTAPSAPLTNPDAPADVGDVSFTPV